MSSQDEYSRRPADFTPTKQALLEQRLRGRNTGVQPTIKVEPKPASTPARLSFAQERMWFANQLNPESPAYNMHAAYRLQGMLNYEALDSSLVHIIHRHEILRTRFLTDGGQTTPVVADQLNFSIPLVDLSHLPDAEQNTHLSQLGRAEARHIFNLPELPLLRITLARLSPEDHVIFLTLHHIIADEWSIRLFWDELAAVYTDLAGGRAPNQPPLVLQYADFAYWQRERLAAGALNDQMAYWRSRLAPPHTRIQFPYDHPRPPVQRHDGAIAALDLPAGVRRALEQLNRQTGTTPFMILLALYCVLLHRYSGQDDLFIGVPITNRNQKDFEALLGVCLNTLVLRIDMSGSPSFIDLLGRVREAALEAFANSELPFEKLVEELNPERDLSCNPLFQVMFVYQSQSDKLSLPGLQTTPYPVDGGVSKFDLTLFAGERGDEFEIFLEYNTSLILESTARRLLSHYAELAKSISSHPDTPVSQVPLLTSEERNFLLASLRPAPVQAPAYNSILEPIEHWAGQTPDAPALRDQYQGLTYAGLNKQANRLAQALRTAGVANNVIVGLCAERSVDLFVGMLGILKAGGAYLPLDPKYPHQRREFMIQDAGVKVIVSQPQFADLFAGTNRQVFLLSSDALEGWQPLEPCPPNAAHAEDLAYIIYTSGSTGQPKGVPVSHGNLIHSTMARIHYYPEKIENFLLLSSFAFDSSIAGIFGTLCSGGTLYLPAQGQEQDVAALAELVERYQVTHMLCLPALYNLLLEYAHPRQLAALKVVIVAGEACPLSLARQHYSTLPATALYNEYGPTEGTVWCSVYRVPPDLPWYSVPIGQAIENTQLYILDQHLEPVPVGVRGRLYLAGPGLVRGYWNRPDLTKERFIEHAWDETGPVRLYHTGDLARWLPDGNIEFLGRSDQQVKIRGNRIELEEIENALLDQPGVSQAVVLVRENPSPDQNSQDLEGLAALLMAAGEQGLLLLRAAEDNGTVQRESKRL